MKVERPCLQYHLGHCEAPCVNYISKTAYQKQARLAVDALEGRNKTLYRELQDKMEAAATAEQFEKAAMYRDQLAALKIIQEQQDIVTTGAGYRFLCRRR